MFKKIKLIVKNHFIYVLCSLIYFYLGGFLLSGRLISQLLNGNFLHANTRGFIISSIIYIVSVIIALSPLGEKLFRLTNRIRSLETNEEKEYLIPIARDVLNSTKKAGRNKLWRFEICVIDTMNVNACAVGMRTIAVTKGAIKTFDEEQLKGIIAHEIGHINTGDTIANTFLLIGSGFFYPLILLCNLFILLLEKTSGEKDGKSILRKIFNIFIFAFSFLMQLTLMIESREREYNADETAFSLGYGEELISALYLLEKISLGDNRTIIQKMISSHPRITARIGRLEDYVREQSKDK